MWPSGESAGSDTESGNFVSCTHCERSGTREELRHDRATPIASIADANAAIVESVRHGRQPRIAGTRWCGPRRSVEISFAYSHCAAGLSGREGDAPGSWRTAPTKREPRLGTVSMNGGSSPKAFR